MPALPRLWFYPPELRKTAKVYDTRDMTSDTRDCGYLLCYDNERMVVAYPTRNDDCVVIPTGYGSLLFDIDKTFPNTICTPTFGRLNNLQQLSTASKTYACATHDRWTHSVLTCYLSYRVAKALGFDEYAQRLVAMMGLVHDLNHLPFGHSADQVYKELMGGDMDSLTLRKVEALHKEIEKDGVRYDDLVKLLSCEDARHQIVDSPIGTDRGAYIPLDFMFSSPPGSQQGFNYFDMIRNFVYENGNFGIRRRAAEDAETMLLQRMRLYGNLYYHPMKQVGERMVQQLFAKLFREKIMSPEQFPDMTDGVIRNLHLDESEDPLTRRLSHYIEWSQWPLNIAGMLKIEGQPPEDSEDIYKIDVGIGALVLADSPSSETARIDATSAEQLSERGTSIKSLDKMEERARKLLGVDYAACAVFPPLRRFHEDDALVHVNGQFRSIFDFDRTFGPRMDRRWQRHWRALVAVDSKDYETALKRVEGSMEEIFLGDD